MPDIGNASVFSQIDGSNNSGTNPGWPEGMAPSRVNDSGRAFQGAVKRDWDYTHYTVTSAGTASAQTLTYTVAPELNTNQMFGFIAGFAPTGATTLNINALGAKTIKKLVAGVATDIASGDWAVGDQIIVRYDGTNMVIVGANTANFAKTNASNTFTASNSFISAGGNTTTIGNSAATGANGDYIGGTQFTENNSSGSNKAFASAYAKIVTATAGSEAGEYHIGTTNGTSSIDRFIVGQGAYTPNATGGDKGMDTINANGYYIGGRLFGCPNIILEDQKASGTAAQSITSGSDVQRNLNTVVVNDGSVCTLSANQFTLPAGTYDMFFSSPAYSASQAQAFIQNVTDSTVAVNGTGGGSTAGAMVHCTGRNRIVIAASKTFEVRMRVITTSNGGNASGFGRNEVYTRVEITKVA